MTVILARFSVGKIVHHKLYDYRGVIVDVDPNFQGDDDWYETVASSRPPKDEPWYHVLVHNAVHRTYVAECNLELDPTGEPIDHPEVEDLFGEFEGGAYKMMLETN